MKKIISIILTICILTLMGGNVFALDWSGSSNLGGSSSGIARGGFSLPYANASKDLVGYRFSVLTGSGITLKKIDLYYNSSYMPSYKKFLVNADNGQVQNKYQLKSNWYGSYRTEYKSIEYMNMPYVTEIGAWTTNNADTVLNKMGFSYGTKDLYYGDKLIVEPLFMIVINGEKLTMTISDIAMVGSHVFGKDGNVFSAGWSDGTWGFVANFTQKIYPNLLHTDTGSEMWGSLWGYAPTLNSIATFGSLLDNGYGVGVAFQSYKDPIIDVTIKHFKYETDKNEWTLFETSTDTTVDVSSYIPSEVTAPSGYYYDNWNYMGNNIFHVNYLPNPSDIYPEYIIPNSKYTKGTEIIVSYYIHNQGEINFTESNKIDVDLKVYSVGTLGKEKLILEKELDTIVPKNEKNLVYTKLTIPTDSAKLRFEIIVNSGVAESNTENNTLINEVSVYSKITSQTPDTDFESMPIGFTVPSEYSSVPTMGQALKTNSTWQVWEWENNDFKLNTYGIQSSIAVNISADSAVKTEIVSGNTTMLKSGYGIQTEVTPTIGSYGGFLMPETDAYTQIQDVNMFFPEFNYSTGRNKFRTLEEVNGTFYFEKNENTMTDTGAKDYRRTHFIPIYFPDINYVVKTYAYNLWTPVGMINSTAKTKQIKVSGDIYDDWAITTH